MSLSPTNRHCRKVLNAFNEKLSKLQLDKKSCAKDNREIQKRAHYLTELFTDQLCLESERYALLDPELLKTYQEARERFKLIQKSGGFERYFFASTTESEVVKCFNRIDQQITVARTIQQKRYVLKTLKENGRFTKEIRALIGLYRDSQFLFAILRTLAVHQPQVITHENLKFLFPDISSVSKQEVLNIGLFIDDVTIRSIYCSFFSINGYEFSVAKQKFAQNLNLYSDLIQIKKNKLLQGICHGMSLLNISHLKDLPNDEKIKIALEIQNHCHKLWEMPDLEPGFLKTKDLDLQLEFVRFLKKYSSLDQLGCPKLFEKLAKNKDGNFIIFICCREVANTQTKVLSHEISFTLDPPAFIDCNNVLLGESLEARKVEYSSIKELMRGLENHIALNYPDQTHFNIKQYD